MMNFCIFNPRVGLHLISAYFFINQMLMTVFLITNFTLEN